MIVQTVAAGKLNKIRNQLNLRGFEYQLVCNANLNYAVLDKAVNFIIAINYSSDLNYPSSVAKALKQPHFNHSKISKDNFSIGFAIGMWNANGLFIFVLQSDIMFLGSSAVRDHFRGWRKILFHHIIQEAYLKRSDLYLVSAHDVIHCCKPKMKPKCVPESWINIYDKTAEYFDMEQVEISTSINIQPYRYGPNHFVNSFYKK